MKDLLVITPTKFYTITHIKMTSLVLHGQAI